MKKNIMNTKAMEEVSKRVMVKAWELKKQDKANVWSLCLKFAWVLEKAGELIEAKKANKVTKKDVNVSEVVSVAKAEGTEGLARFHRDVLIATMKFLHVKRWYRIYNKSVMAREIAALA